MVIVREVSGLENGWESLELGELLELSLCMPRIAYRQRSYHHVANFSKATAKKKELQGPNQFDNCPLSIPINITNSRKHESAYIFTTSQFALIPNTHPPTMPPRPGKPRSLAAALDTKVLSLVRRYIDEQLSSSPSTSILTKSGGLRLSTVQVSQYVISAGDASLSRTKRAVIEKSVDRAILVINKEHDEDIEANDDSVDEDVDVDVPEERDDLVEVRDMNVANRRIVEMWRTQSVREGSPGANGSAMPTTERRTRGGSVQPEGAPTPAETNGGDATPAPKKRKEKSSTREGGSSKRQKGTLPPY